MDRRIDAVCDTFEAAWRAGRLPRIEDYLADAPEADRPALLGELLGLELELRRMNGDRPGPREYLDRFLASPEIVEAAFRGGPGSQQHDPSTGTHHDAACNLLLGILALQNNFIDREALLGAFAAWAPGKASSLGQILRDQGVLDDVRCTLLEALVAEHLKLNGGDAERSLSALRAIDSAYRDLETIDDSGISAKAAPNAGRGTRSLPGEADRGAPAETTASGPLPDWDLETLRPPPAHRNAALTPPADTAREATRSPRAWPAAEPRMVAGYELLEMLGSGGMGVVWKARQAGLNRSVALKMVLGDHRADRKDLIRFLAEAEAVAAVRHPHVVQVYEYGESDGRPFLAMEYLAGGSLAARLNAQGRLEPRVAARLLATLADAVKAAHELGIVHRDLKSGNVLFDEHDRPKVTDFGLAKRAGGSDLTETRAVMGTPAYMAPEQARGDTKFVGPQADVYSLGVILYECLTGVCPFEGRDPVSLLRRVAEEEPERPGRRVPGLPRDAELICLKCLEKDPAERYPTAGALAADLERFASGEPVSVRAAGLVERAAKWARRKPTLAAAYALGLLALMLGGLGGTALWQWREAEWAQGQAERARVQAVAHWQAAEVAGESADRAKDEAERARKDANTQREKLERFEYGRTIEVAHQEWRESNVPATLALLESARPELRGWEWHYVHRLCHLDLLTLKGHTGRIDSASFSPDGARVITASGDMTAKVWDARNGAEMLTLKGHTHIVHTASFSPDGTRILTASEDHTARVWDAPSGAEVITLKGHTSPVYAASFSPDGTRIVTASNDGTAKVWNARSGTEMFTLKGHTLFVYAASFSPDGTHILTASEDHTARVWDAPSGAEVITLKGHTSPVYAASFSPDGTRIVTASFDGTVKVWDAHGGGEVITLKGHTSPVHAASFSPDGSQVVTASADMTAKLWDARNGGELNTLKGHTSPVHAASFSPDGSQVVTASWDGTAKVWNARGGGEVITFKGHTEEVHAASFSPDGTRIVTASLDRTSKVWDLQSGGEALTLKGHNGRIDSASFSPDGTRVITASGDMTAKVWDARSGAEMLTLKGGHTSPVYAASFSPDGARIVTASFDGTAKVWDARSGAEVLTLKGHTAEVHGSSFSLNGARIVTASFDGMAKVWDARSGAEVLTLKGHTHFVYAASFSPDGMRILTASEDHTARVWDARGGGEVVILKGHTGPVYAASFSPDGARVVTASFDRTVKVWDAPSGGEVITLKGHTTPVHAASFSPDGARVVTASYDGKVKIWDTAPIRRETSPRLPLGAVPRAR